MSEFPLDPAAENRSRNDRESRLPLSAVLLSGFKLIGNSIREPLEETLQGGVVACTPRFPIVDGCSLTLPHSRDRDAQYVQGLSPEQRPLRRRHASQAREAYGARFFVVVSDVGAGRLLEEVAENAGTLVSLYMASPVD
jgi:hypothetical protein